MLAVNDFRTYITAIKDAVPEITQSETVIDDSQITKFVEDLDSEVFMIVGIIPKHKFVGKDENIQSKDITSILVMQKIDRSETFHKDLLDIIHNIQQVAQKVIDKLIDDYEDEENCTFIRKLILSSFDVNPFYGLSSCDGYQIDFSLNSDI